MNSKQEALLFHDFNGLPENAAYEWYQHKGNWQNRIIHGESAQVIASLSDRENLTGQVQMVYFDPPYGIKFNSNFQPSTRKTGAPTNRKGIPNSPETIAAFRDNYKHGIHSYLDQMLEKITLCRGLLTDSGSMFVQIGKENIGRLMMVCDEAFGADNRVATIQYATGGSTSSSTLPEVASYILWYAKDKKQIKYRQLYEHLNRTEQVKSMSWAAMVELSNGTTRPLTKDERRSPDSELPKGARLFQLRILASQGESTTGRSEPYHWSAKGLSSGCPVGNHWSVSMKGLDKLAALGRLHIRTAKSPLMWKQYENEIPGRKINNVWHRLKRPTDKRYPVQTADRVVERCVLMSTDPGDLVFDPTCGAGTTALAAEKWGRRWITCDVAPSAVAVARQRITTATFPYWTLVDSVDGQKAETELSGKPNSNTTGAGYGSDPAKGFVYERVHKTTAATLAYGKKPKTVMLVNRPHITKGITRVSSPFTVESMNPHTCEPFTTPEAEPDDMSPKGDVVHAGRVIDALIQTKLPEANGRMTDFCVTAIEEWPCDSSYIDNMAFYDYGTTKGLRAGLYIAGETVTVSAAMINQAAFDTAKHIPGADLLFVVAFGFESTDMPKNVGKVKIVRLNPHRDLTIGDLKPAAKHQALVILSEPDIRFHDEKDDKISVELLGYDSYNPENGQVESQTREAGIACWMIDTDHDGRSFFARRIHFPDNHNDKQLKRLRKVLARAVNKEAWDSMLSLDSAPFAKPPRRPDGTPGRIAVKIVTHTGTEMTVTRKIAN